MLSDLQR